MSSGSIWTATVKGIQRIPVASKALTMCRGHRPRARKITSKRSGAATSAGDAPRSTRRPVRCGAWLTASSAMSELVSARPAGLHLDEHGDAETPRHEVDLADRRFHPAPDDPVALQPQVPCRHRLAAVAENPPRRAGVASDYSWALRARAAS